jgi:hypothetical protein
MDAMERLSLATVAVSLAMLTGCFAILLVIAI